MNTYTDAQLKQALAKMLPEKIETNMFPSAINWTEAAWGGRKVLDAELLHLCWLVEETLSELEMFGDQTKQGYHDYVLDEVKEQSCIHATWQQKVIGLTKVKGVEVNNNYSGWTEMPDPQFNEAPASYHIKPEPHLRPWKPEEVPVGALIKNRFLRSMILGCDNNGTCYVSHTAAHFITEELLNDWEYSLDHGKTWLPCGVEE